MAQSNNPYFDLFPAPSDRTAWRPFGLPVILVAPYALDNAGRVLGLGQIISVRIFIETESSRVPVSGPTHVIRDANGRNIGVHKPDQELFVQEFNQSQIVDRMLLAENITVVDGAFSYTTRSGVNSTLDYSAHAAYYDFSDVKIATETLAPDHYNLIYEVTYYNRKISETTDELLCIDEDDERTSRFTLDINHPGEVIHRLVDITPPIYMTTAKRSEDTTIGFYQPFTEILQDAHDEQNFIESINWIYNIEAEYIPYLSYILGWDLPNVPPVSAEVIHRIMLKNVVRLQELKGTKRSIRELVDLFSTVVNITNVWWTPDGTEYVGVNETADDGTSIVGIETVTTEPLLYEYTQSGFGNISVPFINRPYEWRFNKDKSVTIRAILLQKNTAAYTAAQAISTDIGVFDYTITNPYADPNLPTTDDITDRPIEELMAMTEAQGIVGTSTLVIDNLGQSSVASSDNPPVSQAEFDYENNAAAFNFAQHIDFDADDLELYVYATYPYYKVIIPTSIVDLQSNRFDLELFGDEGGNINLEALPFIVNYLFKIKAFHSILRKIMYTLSFNEVYQVTDWCVGGEFTQQHDTDAGMQQVPPEAIIPLDPTECLRDPEDLGYRPWDIDYREVIINRLEAEFAAWKARDTTCAENNDGQSRTQQSRTQARDIIDSHIVHADNERSTLCTLNNKGYCYTGRVADVLITKHDVPICGEWRFSNDCVLKMGVGSYYTYGEGKDETSIHYTNKNQLDNHDDKLRYLAAMRYTLGIQKTNLGIPGHRMPAMSNLEEDFTHPSLKLRPWDAIITCGCPIPEQDWMNAVLTIGLDGDEYITYDDESYVVYGNGLPPDIFSLSEHLLTTEATITPDEVAHAVWTAAVDGHAAITLDQLDTVGTAGELEITPDPLFDSAALCGSNYEDYIDGYPSSTGYVISTDYSIDYFPASDPGTGETLETILGVPGEVTDFAALFTVSSFIKDTDTLYKGYRLDCGCLSSLCGTDDESEDIAACGINEFINEFGQYEFNPDRLTVAPIISLTESANTDLFELDTTNEILFELLQINGVVSENGYPASNPYPDNGTFTYKDHYGVIYEISWEVTDEFLDIVVLTKDPRVPGVSADTGRVVGHEIYRNGVLTTTRTVMREVNEVWSIIASGSTSVIGEFQSTWVCASPLTNPFVYHVDHSIQDSFSYSLDGGHSFTTEGKTEPTVTREDSGSVLDFIFPGT
jgi:hypothetical protein